MKNEEFKPNVDERQIASLAVIRGERGRFAMALAGGIPDFPNAFYYGDDLREFFFYATVDENGITVDGATTHRFMGLPPIMDTSSRMLVEQNIRQAFYSHEFFTLREGSYSDIPVKFTWSLSK